MCCTITESLYHTHPLYFRWGLWRSQVFSCVHKAGLYWEEAKGTSIILLELSSAVRALSSQCRKLAIWLQGCFIFRLVLPISRIDTQEKHWLMPAFWNYVRQSWRQVVGPPFSPAWFVCHPYSKFKICIYRMQKEESEMLAVKFSSGTSRVYF